MKEKERSKSGQEMPSDRNSGLTPMKGYKEGRRTGWGELKTMQQFCESHRLASGEFPSQCCALEESPSGRQDPYIEAPLCSVTGYEQSIGNVALV